MEDERETEPENSKNIINKCSTKIATITISLIQKRIKIKAMDNQLENKQWKAKKKNDCLQRFLTFVARPERRISHRL